MKNKILGDPLLRFFVAVIGLIAIAMVLKELQHIFIPFVIAYFLFFIFSPLNFYFRKVKLPTLVIILIDISIIAVIVSSIGGFLVDSLLRFSTDIQTYFDKLNYIVRDIAASLDVRDSYFRNFSIQKIIAKLDYKELAGGVFSSAFSMIGSVLFVLFFFVFIVSGHQDVMEAIRKRYVSAKVHSEEEETDITQNNYYQQKEIVLDNAFKEITQQIQKYIITKIGINLAAGILTTAALYILEVDFPIIWGLFTFLLNFIPSIGSAISLTLPSLMSLLQHDTLGYGILTAAIMAFIQTIAFNIIEPLLIGKRLDLNPIIILLSVLVWGYIWGIVGMLLAIPLTAIIKIIISTSESENLKFISDLMDSD